MADDFSRGALAGAEVNKSNPFNAILSRFQEAQARRYKEDQTRKAEEAELSKALSVLSYQKTYENELMKAKAEEDRLNILLRGQVEGKIEQPQENEAALSGTPFEAITKKKSPIIQKQQIKDTNELAISIRKSEETKRYIDEALKATDKIPQGKAGQINIGYQKMFNPKNPILGEWQKIKSVLSDLQLGKLQFTKGAISDREMDFFKEAVANDNIMSAPKIKLILNRAKEEMDTEIESKKRVYIKNYEEDPDEFLGRSSKKSGGQTQGSYKPGDTKNIGGVNYTRNEVGQWLPS